MGSDTGFKDSATAVMLAALNKVGDDAPPRIWSHRGKFMPEPLAASSLRPSPAEEPPLHVDLSPEELEVARLEGLLSTRSRDLSALRREFSRCDHLLREALERMATSSADELAALRRGYEAAVDRAVEAEFARAELTFTLDETRAQLGA